MTTPTLAARIAAASKEVGGKLATDKTNVQQSYDYISADKILAVCGQALADQGVVILPAVTHVEVNRLEYQSGKSRYDASVSFVFTLTDGDKQFELPFAGCGSDYSVPDKAVYKAITSGHKYFISKLLNIGAGNEDGEHDEAEKPEPKPAAKPTPQPTTRPSPHAESEVEYGMPEVNDPLAANPEAVKLRKQAHAIGTELYGKDKWEERRHSSISTGTKKRTNSLNGLTLEELRRFVQSLQETQDLARQSQPEPVA